MDKNHPDKFFFFDIGQYAIMADANWGEGHDQIWQDTFTVLK